MPRSLSPIHKGKASQSRMFNHLKRHSANPSGGIYMFIKVTQPTLASPTHLKTGGSIYDYTFIGTGTLTPEIVNAQIGTAKSVCIEGYTIIDAQAFFYNRQITSVTIGNSVTTIGYNAFLQCSNLSSVTIGNSVTTIDVLAFYYCSSLTSVTIPNSVTYIGQSAFRNCTSLSSVTIGNSVTEIHPNMFRSCINLTSVTIPNSVKYIYNYAFHSCTNFTSVTIPNSVIYIASQVFTLSGLATVYISSATGAALTLPVTVPSTNVAFYGKNGVTTIVP